MKSNKFSVVAIGLAFTASGHTLALDEGGTDAAGHMDIAGTPSTQAFGAESKSTNQRTMSQPSGMTYLAPSGGFPFFPPRWQQFCHPIGFSEGSEPPPEGPSGGFGPSGAFCIPFGSFR